MMPLTATSPEISSPRHSPGMETGEDFLNPINVLKPIKKATDVLQHSHAVTAGSGILGPLERLFYAKKFYTKHPQKNLEEELGVLLKEISNRFRVHKNPKPKKKEQCINYIFQLLSCKKRNLKPSDLTETSFFKSMHSETSRKAGWQKIDPETHDKVAACIVPAFRKLAQTETPHDDPFSEQEELEINDYYAGFLERTMTLAEIEKTYNEIQAKLI